MIEAVDTRSSSIRKDPPIKAETTSGGEYDLNFIDESEEEDDEESSSMPTDMNLQDLQSIIKATMNGDINDKKVF